MTETYSAATVLDTEEVGRKIAEKLIQSGTFRAFLALRGDMGAGKTAFVRGFASALGITGVRSPTYTVVNEYSGLRKVFHFDLYRLEGEEDLESIGFEDYLKKDGFCLAEWPERAEGFLPPDRITVTIRRETSSAASEDGSDNLARSITVEYGDEV